MLRAFIRFLITIVVVAAIGFLGIWGVRRFIYTHENVAIDRNATQYDYVEVEIVSGMSAGEVLAILYNEGLIRNETIAGLLVRFNSWGAIQVGEYHVYAGMSLNEMFAMFRGGDVTEMEFIYVIIPEGLRITGIAEIFTVNEELELDMDAEELLELWSDTEFLAELIDEYWFLTDDILNPELIHPLEGYIYPIRHEIPVDFEDVREMTRVMLDMSEHRLEVVRAEIEDHDLSIHEILTFASIIEGETQNEYDKVNVAGVFQNRLDIGMLLQTDVSAQYLAPERQELVTYDMLEVDSPFNTYIYLGLPVGPMNSPSINAIRAAMEPASHGYFFFISDMFGCAGEVGSKIYAVTHDEHLSNRNRYLNPAHANDGECL